MSNKKDVEEPLDDVEEEIEENKDAPDVEEGIEIVCEDEGKISNEDVEDEDGTDDDDDENEGVKKSDTRQKKPVRAMLLKNRKIAVAGMLCLLTLIGFCIVPVYFIKVLKKNKEKNRNETVVAYSKHKKEPDWDCDANYNFILGVQYSQISLTDYCNDENVCDANPIYGGTTTDAAKAVAFCKNRCKNEINGCNGFFFQRHQNGHEICGFYLDPVDMHAGTWVWHGHSSASRVCELIEKPSDDTQSPTISPTTSSPNSDPTSLCEECAVDNFRKVECGNKCHPIQWPYNMRGCFPRASALQDCADKTKDSGGIAFSLQDCYDKPGEEEMYCFIYRNAPANPPECQNDVFANDSCTYGTKHGSFYIVDEKYRERFFTSIALPYTFGNRTSYCVTSAHAGIWDEPNYYAIGSVTSAEECIFDAIGRGNGYQYDSDNNYTFTYDPKKLYSFVHYWHETGLCRGLYECPFEYNCKEKGDCLTYETNGLGVRTYDVPKNVALGKAAFQSSNYGDSWASLAVDGYRNLDEKNARTDSSMDVWWRVDLGNLYTIREIRVYSNSIDLLGGTIHVLKFGSIIASFRIIDATWFQMNPAVVGDEIRIENDKYGLSLSEVEVYADSV